MPRRPRAAVCARAILLVLLLSGLVHAADHPAGGTLTGQVTALKGSAPFTLPGIPDVKVTIEPGGHSAVTDKKGRFSLTLPPGVYDVAFDAPGFAPYSQKVAVPTASAATISLALFPEPAGPPIAALKRGGQGPQAGGPVPYNTTVTLDATESRNLSRDGIRWEVRAEDGAVVNDPYSLPARPLQLTPSPIPGSSPLSFTFAPPRPGKYTVQLYLRNSLTGDKESMAEVAVEARNTPPEAYPTVIAGPEPPGKIPTGRLKSGSGLPRVTVGETVYLAGWALDKNMPSPELYNDGGRVPDAYGKNDDRLQRQFTWRGQLGYLDVTGQRTDVTAQLASASGGPAAESQYPHFTAKRPGRYLATLSVGDRDPAGSLTSAPAALTVTVLAPEGAKVDEAACAACHPARTQSKSAPGAKPVGGMSCQGCHGLGAGHLATQEPAAKQQTMAITLEAAQCGRCHSQYAEWEKSRHSDGYPFGFYEIAQPLLLNCTKCHYPQGFATAVTTAKEKNLAFGAVEFKKPMYPGGPLFFDFDRLPGPVGQGVSCQACHDPHQISSANESGLRMEKARLCGACHEEKWQNVLLEGTAGQLGSAYEYPGEKYGFSNPHDSKDKCVLCHMNREAELKDANGLRALGGHTMRMRDAGPDGRLGGFGPSPDDASRPREQASADDRLNLAPCRKCHASVATFDIGWRQKVIYQLWQELGDLLRARNKGVLPGYKPGDKCATCHRGGTLPFVDDPSLTLENAYTNYKLVMNDRSWGIHNYQYTKKLLEDSIRSVKPLQ